MSQAHRMALIERDHRALSIAHQCALVGVSRSLRYYTPKGENADNEHLMCLIDKRYLKTPWYGLGSVYPRPKTSKPHPAHAVYPYLLRELAVNRPDQVWCADVTYIPLHRGFMYRIASMDWYSRRVLTWQLSNTALGRFLRSEYRLHPSFFI
jgi:putative transposase